MEPEARHRYLAHFAFGGLALGLALVTCAHRDASSPGTTTTTTAAELPAGDGEAPPGHGADPRPIETRNLVQDPEAENLAQALCERKRACDEIGANRPHASMDACMQEARRAATMDLQAMRCPQGFAEPVFDTCATEVRAQPCGAELDVLADVEACSQASLCTR